jgi:glucose-1-phosphate thymidylyltransferase
MENTKSIITSNINNTMKGIILAGGSGTRLHPLTLAVSKQLLPIYDKPMIYYSLSVLMLAGIKDILIISTPQDLPSFKKLLGTGERFGIKLSFEEQPKPEGLAQAFIIGEKFIGNDDVCLILGDNFFHGGGLANLLMNSVKIVKSEKKAVIFASYVKNPENFGIVHLGNNNNILSIEEKPSKPKSNFAVVGLYFYPNNVIQIAKNVKPSKRGELEITSVNQMYLKNEDLILTKLSRGYAWLDSGTHESLTEATEFVKAVEKRTGLKIACLEEIALIKNYISKSKLLEQIKNFKGDYYNYIKEILN